MDELVLAFVMFTSAVPVIPNQPELAVNPYSVVSVDPMFCPNKQAACASITLKTGKSYTVVGSVGEVVAKLKAKK